MVEIEYTVGPGYIRQIENGRDLVYCCQFPQELVQMEMEDRRKRLAIIIFCAAYIVGLIGAALLGLWWMR